VNSVSIDPPKLSIDLFTIHVDRSTKTIDRLTYCSCQSIDTNSRSIDILQQSAVTSPEHLYLDFYQNIRFRSFLTVRCDQNGTVLTVQIPI
jgi:hypothetical protein